MELRYDHLYFSKKLTENLHDEQFNQFIHPDNNIQSIDYSIVVTILFLILKKDLDLKHFNVEELFDRINKRNLWETKESDLCYRTVKDKIREYVLWKSNEEKRNNIQGFLMEELFNITYRKLGKEDLTFIYLLYTYTHLPKLVHDGMKKAPVRSYTKNF